MPHGLEQGLGEKQLLRRQVRRYGVERLWGGAKAQGLFAKWDSLGQSARNVQFEEDCGTGELPRTVG